MLLAVLFIVGGLFRTAGASVIKFPWWGWTVLSGIVSVGLGDLPFGELACSQHFLRWIVIGVDLLFDGGALVAFASAIHSLPGE